MPTSQSVVLSQIQQSFEKYITDKSVKNTPIYIACSGGRDSMCLVYACLLLKLPIFVIHINHKLQKMSDEWQILVEQFCQTHQIAFQSYCLDWQNRDIDNVNEAKARTARYQAICQIVAEQTNIPISKTNYPIIATAHHANDQVETILMNLCQGAGLAGLSGMAAFAEQHEFGMPLRLWRPLLSITREQISNFVKDHKIPYVDDPTNIGEFNKRAILREQILPLLDKIASHSIENISRTAKNVQESKTIIDSVIRQDLDFCQLPQRIIIAEQRLDIAQLKKLSRERLFQLLHFWLKGEKKFAPNRQTIEQIYKLIFTNNSEQQTIIHWQGIHIRRYQSVLYRLDSDCYEKINNSLSKNMLLSSVDSGLDCKMVSHNAHFRLLGKQHHSSFKKICQAYHIPVWERQFVRIVIKQNRQIAICFLDKCLLLSDIY